MSLNSDEKYLQLLEFEKRIERLEKNIPSNPLFPQNDESFEEWMLRLEKAVDASPVNGTIEVQRRDPFKPLPNEDFEAWLERLRKLVRNNENYHIVNVRTRDLDTILNRLKALEARLSELA